MMETPPKAEDVLQVKLLAQTAPNPPGLRDFQALLFQSPPYLEELGGESGAGNPAQTSSQTVYCAR